MSGTDFLVSPYIRDRFKLICVFIECQYVITILDVPLEKLDSLEDYKNNLASLIPLLII